MAGIAFGFHQLYKVSHPQWLWVLCLCHPVAFSALSLAPLHGGTAVLCPGACWQREAVVEVGVHGWIQALPCCGAWQALPIFSPVLSMYHPDLYLQGHREVCPLPARVGHLE
uniref:Uncharacterized protein n=1 Tax=Macaca fascicularis TaxID=9541 RepID=Q9BE17_MACFA|nr:hypothetical protein [Macaca fascicularis]